MALAGLSLEVRVGESPALLGANGAGKSTLLRILAALLVPTAGHARVAGHDTVHHSRDVRRCLGYHAGTDHGFYPRLTARQNLLFFGRLNQLSNAAASQRISVLAEQFEIGDALLSALTLLPGSMAVFAWALRRTKITGTLTHS